MITGWSTHVAEEAHNTSYIYKTLHNTRTDGGAGVTHVTEVPNIIIPDKSVVFGFESGHYKYQEPRYVDNSAAMLGSGMLHPTALEVWDRAKYAG